VLVLLLCDSGALLTAVWLWVQVGEGMAMDAVRHLLRGCEVRPLLQAPGVCSTAPAAELRPNEQWFMLSSGHICIFIPKRSHALSHIVTCLLVLCGVLCAG
jgi:hypothetical protein